MKIINSLSTLNIKVIKPKVGPKLHHGLQHQVLFIYCWNNYFFSCHVIMNHEKLPLPPNSEILEMIRNVKSACNSLVCGNDTFYFYYICIILQCDYFQTSNIRCTLVGNELVDHSDVVGESPVGSAPTTSSYLTWQLASIDCAKATARRDKKHLRFEIWCHLY